MGSLFSNTQDARPNRRAKPAARKNAWSPASTAASRVLASRRRPAARIRRGFSSTRTARRERRAFRRGAVAQMAGFVRPPRWPAGRHRVPTWQDRERPGAAETWTRARVTWRSTTPSPTCLAFRLPHGSSQASHGGRQTRTRLNNARSDFRIQSSSSMWLLVYSLVHTAATTTTTYLPNYTVYMYTMPTNYLRVSSLYPAFSLFIFFPVNIYKLC